MRISCEDYYENYLGDWCNNKCDRCFAEKEIYIVQEDFSVIGSSVLDKILIHKGGWYWVLGQNSTHIVLTQGDNMELRITHEMFEKYFGLEEK